MMGENKNNEIPSQLEIYFSQFRKGIIGLDHHFDTQYGNQHLLYADWVASGRLYSQIEDIMRHEIGPMIANTHSFSSQTGKAATYAYLHARSIIKKHVNAGVNDCLVTTGTGMTAAITKLQRIIGLRADGASKDNCRSDNTDKPVVFITHMEHHSNQVPWYETNADVVILPGDENNLVNPKILAETIIKYADRKVKIGAFTACSNVTGIITPYHDLAKIMHQYGGYCFVDFAASAPYVSIDMHPEDADAYLDAIMFSPHKFLGGPGTCGVLVFNEKLYQSSCPDNPGGGNVKCTDPWGRFYYSDAIEVKEDGGTPGFLQVMRAALSMQLKDKMNTEKIKEREKELLSLCFNKLNAIEGVTIFGDLNAERIGCVSFNVEGIHYNLMVRLLNDRFGIQVRGGWSCASTYAHSLLDIDKERSEKITTGILEKNLTEKPGWVRVSLHPTMSNDELLFIIDAIAQISKNIKEWQTEYNYNPANNEFESTTFTETIEQDIKEWFTL